jgi:hypothetical protein
MTDPKVVSFPAQRQRRTVVRTGDEKLAHDVHAAWRKLWRAIDAARDDGLHVEISDNRYEHPKVTRRY